jgi:8-oxo-dGTP pyrophosphatase MutT (NUDIX family)
MVYCRRLKRSITMWLITTFGFFSVVQKAGTMDLTIRARVREDLELLKERYLPRMGPIQDSEALGKHTDYRFRASASHDEVADAMAAAIREIRYANFKNEVKKRQGDSRAAVYGGVWDVLYQLQVKEDKKPRASLLSKHPKAPTAPNEPSAHNDGILESFRHPAPATVVGDAAGRRAKSPPLRHLKPSFGTVLYDPSKHMFLLRVPSGYFGGMCWTHAKGQANPDESPEYTAIRETFEETGFSCRIISPIPGEFVGQTSVTKYWLAVPVAEVRPFDPAETEEVRWVSPEAATEMIRQGTNQAGIDRDIAVLLLSLSMVQAGACRDGKG